MISAQAQTGTCARKREDNKNRLYFHNSTLLWIYRAQTFSSPIPPTLFLFHFRTAFKSTFQWFLSQKSLPRVMKTLSTCTHELRVNATSDQWLSMNEHMQLSLENYHKPFKGHRGSFTENFISWYAFTSWHLRLIIFSTVQAVWENANETESTSQTGLKYKYLMHKGIFIMMHIYLW